jgi:hypothetical protein
VDAAIAEARLAAPERAPRGSFRCLVGLGAAAGAAKASGASWRNLGERDVRGGASPLASAVCRAGPGPVQGVVGADSAPFFRYAAVPEDPRHVVGLLAGGQLSAGATAVGLYGTVGFTSRGVGVRAVWTGLRDWADDPMGFELRAQWLAPELGVEAAVSWVWTL